MRHDPQQAPPSEPPSPGADTAALQDELLAVRCQLGEPEAFTELVNRWHGPLQRYLRRVVGDDSAADDVLQESWLRILRGMPSLQDAARLRPWIFGIARRTAMDRLRRRYTRRETAQVADSASLLQLSDEGDAADADLRALEDAEAREVTLANMRTELAALPLQEREVLVLFYLQDLSLRHIAELIAVPIGTVKSRLHRARQLLRHRLTHTEASS